MITDVSSGTSTFEMAETAYQLARPNFPKDLNLHDNDLECLR